MTGGKKITITYTDGSVEAYTIAAADVTTLVETDAMLKFKGTLSSEGTAKNWRFPLPGKVAKYSVEDT